jgi:hypothetical protein
MKLTVEKRAEMLSSSNQAFMLEAVVLVPGGTSSSSTVGTCCSSCTCGSITILPISSQLLLHDERV